MAAIQRRPNGTGSITQRKNGTWAGLADFGYVGTGRCRKFVYAPTREEAERKLEKLLAHGPGHHDGLNPHAPGPPRAEADKQAAAIETHTLEQWLAKRNAVGCCIYCGSKGPLGGRPRDSGDSRRVERNRQRRPGLHAV